MRWLCHKHQPRRSLRSTFLSFFLLLLCLLTPFLLVRYAGLTFSVQDCGGNNKLNSRRERTPVVPWGTPDLRPIEEKATWVLSIPPFTCHALSARLPRESFSFRHCLFSFRNSLSCEKSDFKLRSIHFRIYYKVKKRTDQTTSINPTRGRRWICSISLASYGFKAKPLPLGKCSLDAGPSQIATERPKLHVLLNNTSRPWARSSCHLSLLSSLFSFQYFIDS